MLLKIVQNLYYSNKNEKIIEILNRKICKYTFTNQIAAVDYIFQFLKYFSFKMKCVMVYEFKLLDFIYMHYCYNIFDRKWLFLQFIKY